MGKIEANKEISSYCHVKWNGLEGYEVLCHGDIFVVDITKCKCTCRFWDLTSIPCPHLICVILFRKEKIEDYVLNVYKKQVNEKIYGFVLPALPGDKFWSNTKLGSIDPPIPRKMPGRPKKNRCRVEGESICGTKLLRRGMKIRCQLCFQQGHNSEKCPNKQKPNTINEEQIPGQSATANKDPIATVEIETFQDFSIYTEYVEDCTRSRG